MTELTGAELLNKLKELDSLDTGRDWQYTEAIDADEDVKPELATVGYMTLWGGVHICNIVDAVEPTETARFIAELHNLLPEVIRHLEASQQKEVE